MLKKCLKLLKISYSFSLPKKHKLLIFDLESYDDFKFLLNGIPHYPLNVRFMNEKIFFVHPLLIIKMIKNYKGNLWHAYIASIIEYISPIKIITNIDTSYLFFEICRQYENRIEIYAIQNGARYDFKIFKKKFDLKKTEINFTNKTYIPNLFCFGKFEIDDYKRQNVNVKNFIPSGSLRLSNYLKESKIHKKIYDICLISDGLTKNFDTKFGTPGDMEKQAIAIQFLIKYSIENNTKFMCCFKRLNSSKKNLDDEVNFYKYFLDSKYFKFLLENSTLNFKKNRYLSYNIMFSSEIAFSAFSTMLREKLATGQKAISLNFMSNDIFEFPLDGICKLKICDYEYFKKYISNCLNMSSAEFIKKIKPHPEYCMEYDKNNSSIEIINKTLNFHALK